MLNGYYVQRAEITHFPLLGGAPSLLDVMRYVIEDIVALRFALAHC